MAARMGAAAMFCRASPLVQDEAECEAAAPDRRATFAVRQQSLEDDPRMHLRQTASLLPAAAGALLLGLCGSAAAGNYDGAWSVRVVGESGACKSMPSLPLRVENGEVRYAGWPSPTTSGKVQNSGKLSLRISFNSDVIVASGDLKKQSGQGSWNSPTLACGGKWFAERGA